MKYLLAVSGGADSMAMLHMLRQEDIHIAHVNHCLRYDSHLDESIVCDYAKLINKPIHVKRLSNPPQSGIENWARECRYTFFNELVEPFPQAQIATAHNANDVAETVIMRIIRGTGIRGLRAIREHSNIIRPIIHMKKSDVYNYCHEHNVPYREDYTNKQPIYFRNRVRLNILNDNDIPQLCNIAKLADSVYKKIINQAELNWRKYIHICNDFTLISYNIPLNDLSFTYINHILDFSISGRIFDLMKTNQRVIQVNKSIICKRTKSGFLFEKI